MDRQTQKRSDGVAPSSGRSNSTASRDRMPSQPTAVLLRLAGAPQSVVVPGDVRAAQGAVGNWAVQRLFAPSLPASGGLIISRNRDPRSRSVTDQGKRPNVAAMVTAKCPNLTLPKEKLALLQDIFNARFELQRLYEKMKPYEGSILSDDVHRREIIQAQMRPYQDFLYRNQVLAVPTEKVLANDILSGDREDSGNEAAFRENLYKTLISYPMLLHVGSGLDPSPLFTFKWGPHSWDLPHDGGRVGFKHVMGIEKFNVAYQAVLTGRAVALLTEMEDLRRGMGGSIYNIQNRKLGETYGHVWNTTVKIGLDLGDFRGYYNDTRGRQDANRLFDGSKGARIMLLAPDGWLHIFSLKPDIFSYDMKEPDDDGYVYLLNKGSEVSGVQRIRTADNRELEPGSTKSGAGWRTRKELNEAEQFSMGAILGDFFEDPSATMSFGQIVIGVIPIVGQIADARDVAAGIYKMWTTGGKDGKLQTALALVGLLPLLGDGIKSAWHATKGASKEASQRAVREAIQEAAPAATERLATKLLKNADEVAAAFPHLSKAEMRALTESLTEMGQESLKGGGDAAKQYAKVLAEHFDRLGGHAGALVEISGGRWDKVAKALASTPEGVALGKRMQEWRIAQIDDVLGNKMKQRAVDIGQSLEHVALPNMARPGTQSFTSDVDISFLGPSATSHRNAAIRMMEETHGPAWRKLLDADIFADPARLHLFEAPLKELGGKSAREAERRIVKESELNVLAKMMKDGASPELIKKMAKGMGAEMAAVTARTKEISALSTDYLAGMLKRGTSRAEVERLAAEMGVSMNDVIRHAASGEDVFRHLELKMDVLHKRFLAAEGNAVNQAAIAEEMATIQGKLNAAVPGPYMTPGGGAKQVTRKEPRLRPSGAYQALSPALGYTALVDDLYMLQHTMGDIMTKGFTEKTAKDMAKYANRLLLTAGQFGIDMSNKSARLLFDNMCDLLALGRKDPANLARATHDLEAAKVILDEQLTELLHAVKKNADEYLDQTPSISARHIGDLAEKSKRVLLQEIALIPRLVLRHQDSTHENVGDEKASK